MKKRKSDVSIEAEVDAILEGFRPVLTQQILQTRKQADTAARSELFSHLQDMQSGKTAAAPAPVKRGPGRPRKNPVVAEAAPVKRKPGRPRKNPLPEVAAASADKPKKKAKAKRVISEEARKKLAENLSKARAAKAAKAKPAKRKAKSEGEAASAPAQA